MDIKEFLKQNFFAVQCFVYYKGNILWRECGEDEKDKKIMFEKIIL